MNPLPLVPTPAAKVSAMLAFTTGLQDLDQALALYDLIDKMGAKADKESIGKAINKHRGVRCWKEIEHLDCDEWWNEVKMAALSTTEAHAYFEQKADQGSRLEHTIDRATMAPPPPVNRTAEQLKACYAKAYGNLRVTSLTLEQRLETCGYWYTITTDDSMAHTAFATERGLLRWLDERGLSLTKPLPPRGAPSSQMIHGQYTQSDTFDLEDFEQLLKEGHPKIKVLDNGEYTLGVVTTDARGGKTVHHLNCNIRLRPKYNHAQTRNELDGDAFTPIDVHEAGEIDSDDVHPESRP